MTGGAAEEEQRQGQGWRRRSGWRIVQQAQGGGEQRRGEHVAAGEWPAQHAALREHGGGFRPSGAACHGALATLDANQDTAQPYQRHPAGDAGGAQGAAAGAAAVRGGEAAGGGVGDKQHVMMSCIHMCMSAAGCTDATLPRVPHVLRRAGSFKEMY